MSDSIEAAVASLSSCAENSDTASRSSNAISLNDCVVFNPTAICEAVNECEVSKPRVSLTGLLNFEK